MENFNIPTSYTGLLYISLISCCLTNHSKKYISFLKVLWADYWLLMVSFSYASVVSRHLAGRAIRDGLIHKWGPQLTQLASPWVFYPRVVKVRTSWKLEVTLNPFHHILFIKTSHVIKYRINLGEGYSRVAEVPGRVTHCGWRGCGSSGSDLPSWPDDAAVLLLNKCPTEARASVSPSSHTGSFIAALFLYST